ncbi:hypothetical protein DYB37_007450 [Aphanomyces astaci]|uniref:protein geranylgeranyltransferase type II n=1 Tax=Aphanomyces astaci TaxID=112090 RepID=A0A418FBH7_APHAT|nr:hypothetical protein DYB37_007450 [Aphanomyces astaci]
MLFNQQPLTGHKLADMMPLFAESIYSSMRRGEGKKIQLHAEDAIRNFCKAQLELPSLVDTQAFTAQVHLGLVKLVQGTLETLRSFPSDVADECHKALHLFVERELELASKSNNEKAQLSSCKSELKSKGTTWLDKQIASGTPFTISMLEEELLRLHASFDFGEPNPAVDEVDIEQEMREFHAQLLDDLKRQYTFHIRRVVLQFIGTAKSLLEKELQVIVLPMPDQKLRERIHESKERVVLDIASQMQGWSFPQEEMVHFGNAVTEYTQQLQDAYSKQNQSASKDSAAREASARYKVAKDALMHSLNEAIIGAIPMSVDALERLYDEHLLRTCTQLSDGHQIKHEKIMQSLKADLATLMMQLKTINTCVNVRIRALNLVNFCSKETEKAALMNAAETERQRTEELANQVKQSQALAAKREQEMHSKLLEKETKSKHLLDELSSQEAKTQALERQLQLAKQKAIELAEEKKRAEAEGLKLASKERQDAQRLIEENSTKQNKLQSELRAIQARLEQQQIILQVRTPVGFTRIIHSSYQPQAKEREVQAAEIAKEKAKQLSLEKDRALKAVERERALREKLSEDILSHQAQTAKLETTMSSVIREKTRETQQLQATLTDQERKTQQLEQELQRMKDQAQALAQEKEHWRRQNEAMAKSKLDMEMQVKDEAARREAAEAAAVQVAAKAAMEAMDVTPEKKRKTAVASSSSKKAKRLDVKAPLPKLSLQEAKRLAKEEMDKRQHDTFFLATHLKYLANLSKQKESLESCLSEHLRVSAFYWAAGSLCALGKAHHIPDELIQWLLACQHPNGGFGGNVGHDRHLLYTCHAVLSLVMLGKEDHILAQETADFVVSLQQPDGSFVGDIHGEVDTKYTYCALSVLKILKQEHRINMDAAMAHIKTCQNFDAGFGNIPGCESHGGHIFTAVGALSMGHQLDKYVDLVEHFVSCKLHWINKDKLIQFILNCQDKDDGGIADRPGNVSDIFHTFFGICGLSMLGYFDDQPAFAAIKKVHPVFAIPDTDVARLGLTAQIIL